ncbi:MAG: signal peptidase I [Candidatus Firestonebacteria bacterium]
MAEEQKIAEKQETGGHTKVVIEWIKTIISALIIALLIRAFIIQAFRIPTGSMESTLLVGDHLMVNKFIYGPVIPFTDIRILPIREIKRREIIVFNAPADPKKDYIKRCVGIPGDKIEVKDKVLYVNDVKQDEPYIQHTDGNISDTRDNFGPVVVPKESYFAMGDNRDNSNDSRFWGFVPKKKMIGKALVIYWPIHRIRLIK